MKQKIFVNKYETIKHEVSECIPAGSKIRMLNTQCAIIDLPRANERKNVIQSCREKVGEQKTGLIQPVTGFKENADSVEVALPSMKRFFPRTV